MKKRFLLFILIMPLFLFGQNKSELGFFLGVTNSGTDLNSIFGEKGSLTSQAHFGYGIHYTYNLSDALGIRFGYAGTKLSGEDEPNPNRGYNFTSSLHELSGQVIWNFLNKKREGDFKKYFSPYLLIGAGLYYNDPDIDFSHNPKPQKNKEDLDNIEKTAMSFPFGGGLNYHFSPKMYLGFEVRRMISTSDYLDGTSVSASTDDKDAYFFAGLTFGMKLGKADKDGDGIADKDDACPEIPGLKEFAGCPDTDGDGVVDSKDECPMVAGQVNLAGCPDSDEDGIADKYDDCPNIKGDRKFKGCPDSDKDGIRDLDDKCPHVKGIRKYQGCPPPDRDGDGVMDSEDNCPDVAGTINGCPDSDGDGVIDKNDKCPDVKGMVDGCPDRDKDGIADIMDKCPDTPGIAQNKGCPAVKKEVKEKIMSIAKAIYFNTGSDVLRASSKKKLNELVSILKKYPAMGISIEGHTDSVGDETKNMTLSQKRAEAVKNYLIKKGIDASRLTATGYGETMPVADNKTKAGRQKNRRVELKSVF